MSDAFVEAFAAAAMAAHAAFNAGDFETAFAGVSADVEWHLRDDLPEGGGVIRGRNAAIRYYEQLRDAGEWQVEPQEFIAAGPGSVVVRQRGTWTGRATRISSHHEFFQRWDVGADGEVVRVRDFERRDDAVRAR